MIVMKFGGTSVEDARAIERVAAIVKDRLPQKPVVVVSAMAKVTDTLLTMARAAGAGERKTALKLCRSLQERHYNTASELLGTALFTDFHSERGIDSADHRSCGGIRRNSFQQDCGRGLLGPRPAQRTCGRARGLGDRQQL